MMQAAPRRKSRVQGYEHIPNRPHTLTQFCVPTITFLPADLPNPQEEHFPNTLPCSEIHPNFLPSNHSLHKCKLCLSHVLHTAAATASIYGQGERTFDKERVCEDKPYCDHMFVDLHQQGQESNSTFTTIFYHAQVVNYSTSIKS